SAVLFDRCRLDTAAQSEISHVTESGSENIRLLGGGIQQRKRGKLKFLQRFGRVQVAEDAPAVVLEDFRVIRHETLCRPLDCVYAAADSRHQVLNLVGLAGHEVDDSVEQSGVEQFVAADADILRALLPGKLVLPSNAGHAARLDGVENAVTDTQQYVCRGERYGAPTVAVSKNDADGWNVELRE